MRSSHCRRAAAAAGALAATIAVLAAPAGADERDVAGPSAPRPDPRVTVVASGLDNPRHLAFGPGGLYVAESGRGGDGPCFVAAESAVCAGTTGAVALLDAAGGLSRVVTGLPSFADQGTGRNASGPHGITVAGGEVYVAVGGPADVDRDALETRFGEAGLFGWVGRITPEGRFALLVDAWRFEQVRNPDRDLGNTGIDSNVVSVVVDGDRLVTADAGDNTIAVHVPGQPPQVLSVFADRLVPNPLAPPGSPPVPMNAVPTAIEQGPDGAYYVAQLTGFPFPVREASVFRVDPVTGAQSVVATGFTNVIDLAFDATGTLWVVEHDVDGLLGPGIDGGISRVGPGAPGGGPEVRRIPLSPGTLIAPGGIAVGPDGALYVTNRGTIPGGGQVLRLPIG
jgi:hypothetical protein